MSIWFWLSNAVGVPHNCLKCNILADSGVAYTTAGIGNELDVSTGVGTVLNRFYVLEPGDVALRDYGFIQNFVPDTKRAQVTPPRILFLD